MVSTNRSENQMRKATIFHAAFELATTWEKIGMASREAIAIWANPFTRRLSGVVVLARNMRMGWGNLVIIRHIFLEERQMKTVDSVYAHLDKIFVLEGKQIVRGQQIGTIGTNRGMYVAHLHFEIRKNLFIGYNQRAFPKDLSNYYVPGAFIAQHRKLHGAGRSALVAVNTFNLEEKGALTDALAPF